MGATFDFLVKGCASERLGVYVCLVELWFQLEFRLSVGVAPLVHSACMRGKTDFLIFAPYMYTEYSIGAILVISYIAPPISVYV